MSHAIHWFEIAVHDLERAAFFYENTLAIRLRVEEFGGKTIAVFPHPEDAAGGALVHDPARVAANGPLIYLGAEGTLDAALERVPGAGGAVVSPKTSIGPAGFIALVRDTEGNVVGLHSHV